MAMTNDPPRIKFPRGIIFGTAPNSLVHRTYTGPNEAFSIMKLVGIVTECVSEGYEIFDVSQRMIDDDTLEIEIIMGRDYVYMSNS